MNVNDLVTFKNPTASEINKDGSPVVFKVIELRGNRVLVESTSDKYTIKSTCVYLASDLVVVK